MHTLEQALFHGSVQPLTHEICFKTSRHGPTKFHNSCDSLSPSMAMQHTSTCWLKPSSSPHSCSMLSTILGIAILQLTSTINIQICAVEAIACTAEILMTWNILYSVPYRKKLCQNCWLDNSLLWSGTHCSSSYTTVFWQVYILAMADCWLCCHIQTAETAPWCICQGNPLEDLTSLHRSKTNDTYEVIIFGPSCLGFLI